MRTINTLIRAAKYDIEDKIDETKLDYHMKLEMKLVVRRYSEKLAELLKEEGYKIGA